MREIEAASTVLRLFINFKFFFLNSSSQLHWCLRQSRLGLTPEEASHPEPADLACSLPLNSRLSSHSSLFKCNEVQCSAASVPTEQFCFTEVAGFFSYYAAFVTFLLKPYFCISKISL